MVYRLRDYDVYADEDVEKFAQILFLGKKKEQPRIYAVLDPIVERIKLLHIDEQRAFRGQLTDYIRLYAFLSQVLPFKDPGSGETIRLRAPPAGLDYD